MSVVDVSFEVSGMTCGHCVTSVATEVGRVDGVQSVDIDLASGALVVTATDAVTDSAVIAAVEEAGYTASRGSSAR